MLDDEVGGDDDRRGGRDRLFVDDRGERDAPRHPGPLRQQHPPEHVEDAARHVARQERLAPGDLRPPEADPVAEAAQDQVPAEGGEDEVEDEDDQRRDQPEDVEMHAFALDLRPLVDDGEDEEAEDENREADLQSKPHPLAAGGLVPKLAPASPSRWRSGCRRSTPFDISDASGIVSRWASSSCWRCFASGCRRRGPRCASAAATTRPSRCPAGRSRPRSTRWSRASTSAARPPRCARSAARRSPPRSRTWRRWARTPGEAYVWLGAPEEMDEAELLEVGEGLAEVAARDRDDDRRRRPHPRRRSSSLAVTVTGHAPRAEDFVTRAGARPGDALVVTGELGGAAAGLLAARRRPSAEGLDVAGRRRASARRQLDPTPRLAAGRALAAAGATAMIDVSDGLAGDAGHVAAASGALLVIDADALPIAAGVAAVAAAAGRDPLELAAVGRRGLRAARGAPARGRRRRPRGARRAGHAAHGDREGRGRRRRPAARRDQAARW